MKAKMHKQYLPVRKPAGSLAKGQFFLHRLNLYSVCTPEEAQEHPCADMPNTLAIHHVHRTLQVPVRFLDGELVYPVRFNGGNPELIYRRK